MELRSCYFCGSTGRTLETRELVSRPAADSADATDATDPAPASVVLCPDCDAKLDRVLAHVLDAGREPSGTAVAPSTPGGTTDAAAATGVDVSTEITFDEEAAGPDATDAGGDPDGGTDGPDATGPGGSDVDVVAGPTATGSTDDEATDGTEEAPDDGGETEADAGTETDGDVVDAEETARDGETDGDGETGTDAGDESSGELRGLGESSAGTYRKALRLLQNREFPMERSALVDVLSSAYDLDYGECERLVDFAVERGWLVEDGDELRRE